MPSWLRHVLRRGARLALVVAVLLGALGLHVHHEHHDVGHHQHDVGPHGHGDAHPDGDGDGTHDEDPFLVHLHALDPLVLPETVRHHVAVAIATLDQRILDVRAPDGPPLVIDPPPARPAA